MPRLLLASLIAIVIAVGAFGATAPSTLSNDEFEVVIRDFDGSAGYTHVYRVTQDALTVSLENDFGQPAEALCSVPLPTLVANAWSLFLADFPLDKLATEYVNPAVDDGLQLRFTIQRGAEAPRRIRVDNMYQADLSRLCSRVAALVPNSCVHRPVHMPTQ